MALNDQQIRAAKPDRKQYELRDGKGLFLVVGMKGTKSWVLRYRDGKTTCRTVLGHYPTLTISAARNEAGAAKKAIRTARLAGKPVREPKKTTQKTTNGLTVAEAFNLYLDDYKRRGLSRPSAIAAMFDNDVLPKVGQKLILDPALDLDLQRLVNDKRDAIRAKGGSGQGSLGFYLAISAFFSWCATTGTLETGLKRRSNPMQDVMKPVTAKRRERWLDASEIGLFMRSLAVANGYAKPLEMALRSLCRRGEILTLTKRMVILGDKDRGDHLLITDTKNGTDHIVPMTAQMKALLPKLDKLADDDVIWRTVDGEALCPDALSKPKARLDAEMNRLAAAAGRNREIDQWVIHDLRRSGASHMDRLGIGDQVIEAVLNHQKEGLRKTYRRYQWFDEKREALERWNSFVDECAVANFALMFGSTA